MVRFCLCNDEMGSFKVVYYLLKKPTRIKKKEKDTQTLLHGKVCNSIMLLLEGFSCTWSEWCQQYWSTWLSGKDASHAFCRRCGI